MYRQNYSNYFLLKYQKITFWSSNVMARFLLEKGRDKADAIWDEKAYTDEKLQQMLNEK